MSTSLKDYLCYYDQSWLKLQQKTPQLLSYEDRALYTTWNISLEHVQRQNDSAARLIQLWGYFDNQDLWFELLAAGKQSSPEWFSRIVEDKLNFDEAMRALCDHRLIEHLGNSDGYGMHSCVHAWVICVLNVEKEVSMARLALNCVGFTVPEKDLPEYWRIEQRLLSHAMKCLEHASRIVDLESLVPPECIHAVNNLGLLYADQGKMKEAETMYLRALDGYEKQRGKFHPATQKIAANLSYVKLLSQQTA